MSQEPTQKNEGIAMTELPITRGADYDSLYRQLSALLFPEDGLLTNMANAVSFLYWSVTDLNWVGFYMVGNPMTMAGNPMTLAGNPMTQDADLLLGPFHGKPACSRIKYGLGVCGTAAKTSKMQNVPDVHAFPGHIPCDSASVSELVIPIEVGGRLFAVLDIDSPLPSRFDGETEEFFLKCSSLIETVLEKAAKSA